MRRASVSKYWPQYWSRCRIGLLATVQLFLTFAMVGMEIGNALVDLYKANVYSGFWSFPFMFVATIATYATVCGKSTKASAIVALICQCIAALVVLVAIGFLIAFVVSGFTLCFGFQCNQTTTGFYTSSNSGYYLAPSSSTYTLLKQVFVSCELGCAVLFFLLAILYIALFIICSKKLPNIHPQKHRLTVEGPVSLKSRLATPSSFQLMSSMSYYSSRDEQIPQGRSATGTPHVGAEQVCPECGHLSPYQPEGNTVQCPKCGYESHLVQHAQQY